MLIILQLLKKVNRVSKLPKYEFVILSYFIFQVLNRQNSISFEKEFHRHITESKNLSLQKIFLLLLFIVSKML